MLAGIMAAAYHLHGRMMVVEIQVVGCALRHLLRLVRILSGIAMGNLPNAI